MTTTAADEDAGDEEQREDLNRELFFVSQDVRRGQSLVTHLIEVVTRFIGLPREKVVEWLSFADGALEFLQDGAGSILERTSPHGVDALDPELDPRHAELAPSPLQLATSSSRVRRHSSLIEDWRERVELMRLCPLPEMVVGSTALEVMGMSGNKPSRLPHDQVASGQIYGVLEGFATLWDILSHLWLDVPERLEKLRESIDDLGDRRGDPEGKFLLESRPGDQERVSKWVNEWVRSRGAFGVSFTVHLKDSKQLFTGITAERGATVRRLGIPPDPGGDGR